MATTFKNPANKVPIDSPSNCASNGTLDSWFEGFPDVEGGCLRFCQLTKNTFRPHERLPVGVRPETLVPFDSPFNCLSIGYRVGGAVGGLWALSGLTTKTDSLGKNFH
jgi:hypothetical protein